MIGFWKITWGMNILIRNKIRKKLILLCQRKLYLSTAIIIFFFFLMPLGWPKGLYKYDNYNKLL